MLRPVHAGVCFVLLIACMIACSSGGDTDAKHPTTGGPTTATASTATTTTGTTTGTTPSFYATLAPGDTISGQNGTYTQPAGAYAQEYQLASGDQISTGSWTVGTPYAATMVQTGDGHVMSLMPNTTVTFYSGGTANYTSLSQGGLYCSSGFNNKSGGGGSGVKVIIKTTNANTGVVGSTFVETFINGTTTVELFDAWSTGSTIAVTNGSTTPISPGAWTVPPGATQASQGVLLAPVILSPAVIHGPKATAPKK